MLIVCHQPAFPSVRSVSFHYFLPLRHFLIQSCVKLLNYSTHLHVGMTTEELSNNFTTLHFSYYSFIPCSLKFKCVKIQMITQSFPGLPRFHLGNPLICPKFQVHNAPESPRFYFLTINIKLNFIWEFPLLQAILHTACWQHTTLLPDGNRGFCSTESCVEKLHSTQTALP